MFFINGKEISLTVNNFSNVLYILLTVNVIVLTVNIFEYIEFFY